MQTLGRGFDIPVHSTRQCFRELLTGMSRPCTVVRLPEPGGIPGSLNAAACAVLLTLADMDTPVWLDRTDGHVKDFFRFHCGCSFIRKCSGATFAVFTDGKNLTGLKDVPRGTAEHPERSATLIIQVESLEKKGNLIFSGPGIQHRTGLGVTGVDSRIWACVDENRSLFPMGLDVILTAGNEAVCLPRTVRREDASCM